MKDLTGQDVSHYHIVERLGSGGMAVVYRAYDLDLEIDVAIKFIRTGAIPPEQLDKVLTRFKREAVALAHMEHPNIIHIYGYGEHEGEPYLVMKYVPGGTLKQYTGRPLAHQDAVKLLLPVARALAHVHEEGMVHRDVKPANILISRRGEPMLSDFGIARILEEETGTLTGTGLGIGTPGYMAPEQWSGKVSPAVDIYALGVVFYELVTGKLPYDADTPVAIFEKQLTDPLPRPSTLVPDLPDEVEQFLFKALARKPEGRHASMVDMIRGMEALLEVDGKATPILGTSPQNQVVPEVRNFITEVLSEPEILPKVEEAPPQETEIVTIPDSGKKSAWPTLLAEKPAAAALGGLVLMILLMVGLGVGGVGPLTGLFGGPKPTGPVLAAVAGETPTLTPGWTASPVPSMTITQTKLPTQTLTSTLKPTKTSTATPAITSTPNAWKGRLWEKDGMEQVFVPAGKFEMGSTDGDSDEKPVHTVYLDAFWMDKTEITNSMFALFVRNTGYKTDAEKIGTGWIWTGSDWEEVSGADWSHPQGPSSSINGKDQWPVVLVTWDDATAYCSWAGKRLPTEAEWEKAARGIDGRKYPWGNNDPGCELANYRNGNKSWCVKDTVKVGSYPEGASPYGVMDMAGNAWEWVNDWYSSSYYSSSSFNNPVGPESGKWRVMRGGGWDHVGGHIRSGIRGGNVPSNRYDTFGFRCVSTSP